MPASTIKSLFLYPIKSMGGIQVDAIQMGNFGPKHDRKYMLVNESGRFITQRSHSVLSQFSLEQVEGGFLVSTSSGEHFIDDNETTDNIVPTQVWKTPIRAREKSKTVSSWFTEQLDEIVHLVEFDDLETRYREHNGRRSPFAFADGYPLLVANENSLISLNAELSTTVEMKRFRANVIVEIESEIEYEIEQLNFDNNGSLVLAKPCERCNIPAIDPTTSVYQRDLHKELKQKLNRQGKVIFGMNAIAANLSAIHTGDNFTY